MLVDIPYEVIASARKNRLRYVPGTPEDLIIHSLAEAADNTTIYDNTDADYWGVPCAYHNVYKCRRCI
jgi:hypothetical protein